MAKFTILYGTEYRLLEEKLHEIYSKHQDSEIAVFDYEENIDNFFNSIQMPSMFNQLKLVVLKNANLLIPNKPSFEDNEVTQLQQALSNNDFFELVMVVKKEAIDKRKKIVKLATEVFELNKIDISPTQWVREYVKKNNAVIDNDAISLLIFRIGKDLDNLANELDKLILYKDLEPITYQDVDSLVIKQLDETIWDLVEATFNNDKIKMINLTNSLLEQREDVTKIYVTLANQYRFLLDVVICNEDRMTASEISAFLNSHPYRTEMALKKVRKFNQSILFEYLESLYNLDLMIKSGKKDKEFAFKEWLLNI